MEAINKMESQRSSVINEFFWLCSGVNRSLLRKCPTEHAKYAGIGGTIFFTACMASLSGGYAISTVFNSTIIAVLFGLFWGLLIFNLDRLIVNTMYSDGKVTISWKEFISGLPRIIMAIFLGIVISTPLELKIFEDAIDIRIEQDKDDIVNAKIGDTVHERDSISNKRDAILNGGVTLFDSQITTNSELTNQLLAELNSMKAELDRTQSSIEGLNRRILSLDVRNLPKNDPRISGNSEKIRNYNDQRKDLYHKVYELNISIRKKQGEIGASNENLNDLMTKKQEENMKESNRLQNAVDSLSNIINEANIRHKDWSEKEIKEKGSFRDKLDVEYKGFQAKMNAFSELKDESTATFFTSLFIMLLFITIEIAPTLLRMMVADGSYEALLEAEKHRIQKMSEKLKKDIDDDVNTEIIISTTKNKDRLTAEVLANKELMERIAKVQAELLQTAIDKWREEELAKINKNPSMYIQSNTTNS